jgi:hypothetical protein
MMTIPKNYEPTLDAGFGSAPSLQTGALVVSVIFKVLAVVILFGSMIEAASVRQQAASTVNLSPTDQTAIVVGIVVIGVIIASWCAFFGYVLSLLRHIAMKKVGP